ncbi:MAG: type II toxin-antitoxin system RelE/ParE family toxin [Terracidiphilus sp.]|jgi:plasmid stabilization system protein ParE
MPPAYQLTLKALDDLDEIWDYIAGDSVDSACRVESAIF